MAHERKTSALWFYDALNLVLRAVVPKVMDLYHLRADGDFIS